MVVGCVRYKCGGGGVVGGKGYKKSGVLGRIEGGERNMLGEYVCLCD